MRVHALRTFQQGTVVINEGAYGDVVESDLGVILVCWRKDRPHLTDLYTRHELGVDGQPRALVAFGERPRW
jgi:hypothetical protein